MFPVFLHEAKNKTLIENLRYASLEENDVIYCSISISMKQILCRLSMFRK